MRIVDVSCTYSTLPDFLSSSRRSTYAGTAGVMTDPSVALGVLSISSLSNRVLSEDMIRLEVIVAAGNTLVAAGATHEAGRCTLG